MKVITVFADQELPGIELIWRDQSGALIDFSMGWTLRAELIRGDTLLHTKTDGITGSFDAPNVVIAWSKGELEGVQPGKCELRVIATDEDERDRIYSPSGLPELLIRRKPQPAT